MSCTHALISNTAISSMQKTTPKTSRVSYVADGVTRQKSITYANSRPPPTPPLDSSFPHGNHDNNNNQSLTKTPWREKCDALAVLCHSLEYRTIFRRFALVLLKISIFLLSWNGCERPPSTPPPSRHGVSIGKFVSGTCGSRLSISISSEMTALFRFYFHFLFFPFLIFPFFFFWFYIYFRRWHSFCALLFHFCCVSLFLSPLIKQIKNISIYTI